MLFDEDADDEVIDEALAWMRKLIVPARPNTPEELNTLEEQYRREGSAPVVFEEDDAIGNAAQIAAAMGLPPDTVPTVAATDEWLRKQWAAR